jgi:hypothetical protein
MRNNEDVGEKNCSIKIKPPQRLQGHLGCKTWVVAKIEKGSCRLPDLPVFWKIAACLAHEPNGASLRHLAGKNVEEGTFYHRRINTRIREEILVSFVWTAETGIQVKCRICQQPLATSLGFSAPGKIKHKLFSVLNQKSETCYDFSTDCFHPRFPVYMLNSYRIVDSLAAG